MDIASPISPSGLPSLIEFHDARIAGLSFDVRSGKCVLSFAHLAGYHEREPDGLCEVWSHRGELVLEGIRTLSLEGGPLEHIGYLDTGRILSEGEDVDPSRLLEVRERLQIDLGFFTGAVLRLTADSGQLRLLGVPVFLQEWRQSSDPEGPR